MARVKAQAIAERRPDAVVLAADTIVVIDGRILGKPADATEANRMLALLRDRAHAVITAVALIGPTGAWVDSDTTRVWMRAYSQTEVETSIARGDPFDKAGAYAIQDPIMRPVRGISGCRDNVIGLPLAKATAGVATFGLMPSAEALAALPEECKHCFAEAGLL